MMFNFGFVAAAECVGKSRTTVIIKRWTDIFDLFIRPAFTEIHLQPINERLASLAIQDADYGRATRSSLLL